MGDFLETSDDPFQRIRATALREFKLEYSAHGPAHWQRVEENAVQLAGTTKGADIVVCRLFAMLHDSKRENEFTDPLHGPRAADFARVLFDTGRLPITAEQLEKLAYACTHHDRGQVTEDSTIGVCWDADRLDLPRVGTTPEARFLSTEAARLLIKRR